MPDIQKVVLGSCDISFNSVDLGHTKGGVEVSYAPNWKQIMVDAYGETAVDASLNGEALTVKVALAEYTIANLKVAMPAGTFAGAANARMTLGRKAGLLASSLAAQLVLHPSREGTRRHDIVLHKAFALETVTLPHKNDEEKLIEVTFLALLDETKSAGNYFGLIGDSTA